MSDGQLDIGIKPLFVAGLLFVPAIASGCSTLDGRDRGYTERVVVSAGGRATAPDPAGVPASSKSAQLTQVATPEPPVEGSESSSASPLSTPAAQRQDELAGVERSYLTPTADAGTSPKAWATRYANLQPAACRAELRRRHIAAAPAYGMALGIAAPMRLVGPLHGVRFVAPGPKSVHGMLDCRLVLLLDDLSTLLDEHGVSVVYVDGFYRPKAHLPGSKSPSQHAFGLAIDIHGFGTKDGRSLVIERDFAGRIGTPVCGAGARLEPESRTSIELRNLVCAMAKAKAFHYLLTPNYDAAHANHLHGDIKRGGKEHVLR